MDPQIAGLMLGSGLAGTAAGWGLARFVRVWLGWALAALLALAVAGFILAGRAIQGWEGLAQVVVAFVFVAPAMLGAALGTALGGWMRGRQTDTKGDRAP